MLSFCAVHNHKLYKRCISLIYLGLVGLLQIIPVNASAEKAIIKEKSEKLETGAKVAILPFENMSGRFFNIDDFMRPFYRNLIKIFDLSSMDGVDEVILELRLRHTGFLSSQEVLEIGQRLGVKAVILVMICLYEETPELRIGLLTKVIGTDKETPILWVESINESGNLTESWFGRNHISNADSLINKVAEDLIKKMSINLMQ